MRTPITGTSRNRVSLRNPVSGRQPVVLNDVRARYLFCKKKAKLPFQYLQMALLHELRVTGRRPK
jgi:hypothetical protein